MNQNWRQNTLLSSCQVCINLSRQVVFLDYEMCLNDLTFIMFPETLHPKRRRTMNPKVWEVESEQEEHSLSLSQHSSPSQSDQEQTPVRKVSDSVTSSQGLRLLKRVNHSSISEPYTISRTQPEFRNVVQTTPQQDFSYFGHQNQLKTEQHQLLHVVRPVKEHKSLETGLIQNLVA